MARILPFSRVTISRVRARTPDAPAGGASRPPASGRRAAPDEEAPALSPDEADRFRTLVLPHLDSAYRFARYLARDGSLAEDIVQDAFLKAYRAFPGFRGGEARAWLFAIVRSTFLSWVRARPAWTPTDDARPEPASEEDTPEDALVRQGEVATVREAISSLPEPFRETLVLRELEELSYRQIAEVSGVPVGTVMSRLARARQMLAAALREEQEP